MIDVDISHIWGQLELSDFLGIEADVADAYAALDRSWQEAVPEPELQRILETARKIRDSSQVCVVVGAQDSCLGSRAAIELLGRSQDKDGPQLLFTGSSFSTRHWNALIGLLQDREVSVIVISRSGTEVAPALALRALRWMLERRYGTDEANRRIYAVTDPEAGALRQMAREEGWEAFTIPAGVSLAYTALTAAGLLPMAVAGIDIRQVLEGAAEAKAAYEEASLENPVWRYAAVRRLMHRSGKAVELFVGFEPGFRRFGLWWQQLAAASGEGPLSVPAEFPACLTLVQERSCSLFETLVRFDAPQNAVSIGGDWKDLDGLNQLEGKTLAFVEEQALCEAVDAHVDAGVPVITMDCGALTEQKVGQLFFFLQLAGSLCAGIGRTGPARQSGGEG